MKTRDLKISIGPINKRFPDATNEILEPLKSPSDDEDLETSDGGEDLVSRSQTPPLFDICNWTSKRGGVWLRETRED